MKTTVNGNVTDAMLKFVGKRTKDYPQAIRIAVVPTASNDRTVKQNYSIWNKLKRDRNPVFSEPADKKRIKAIIQAHMSDTADLMIAANAVGKYMIETIKRHIDRGRSAAGKMKPLSKRTKAIKDKKFPGRPILIRTGQLIDSLTVNIRVNK